MSGAVLRFPEWIATAIQSGPLPTADVIGLCAPLFEQVAEAHECGRVAPLEGLRGVRVEAAALWFPAAELGEPRGDARVLDPLQPKAGGAVEVVRRFEVDASSSHAPELRSLDAREKLGAAQHLAYLPDWRCVEHELGVHDAPSDVLQLGMLLAALALGLDFARLEHLQRFAQHRANLFVLQKELDPAVARAIAQMTELPRAARARDLRQILQLLRGYRDFRGEVGASVQESLRAMPRAERRSALLETLRDRLFEISRRNRLLYFQPSLGMLNATEASVPLVLDVARIDPRSLLVWNAELAEMLAEGRAIELEKVLRFEEAPYLPGLLDRLRTEDARHRRETGFSPLRLALVFLRWHDLKGEKEERIHSPLLLLPVAIEKKKGVKDRYRLVPLAEEAEVNPALRHHLERLYGLELPESVPLSYAAVLELHAALQRAITASEPAVELRRIDRPRIELLVKRARARVDLWRRRSQAATEARSFGQIDYSYEKERLRPLGLELYKRHVVPPALLGEELVEERPKPRALEMAGPERTSGVDPAVRERSFFRLDAEGASNPYTWDFDLSSLVLGHFHYRRMSLVRDYAVLASDEELRQPAFEALFPLGEEEEPASRPAAVPSPPSAEHAGWEELHPIVACDPTQLATLRRARAQESFLIQGPPGTGKSQTITNLIADQVALGRRVLFVCEKRAAIDVVHERLKQSGLERLCVLIHDSQGDKKAFIQELKATYEDWAGSDDEAPKTASVREQASAKLRRASDSLRAFDEAMGLALERDGTSLRALLSRAVELDRPRSEDERGNGEEPLDDAEAERWPGYALWQAGGEAVLLLERELRESGLGEAVAHCALARLHVGVLRAERPLARTEEALQATEQAFAELERALASAQGLASLEDDPETLAERIEAARSLAELARAGALELLAPQSGKRARLRELAAQRKGLREALLAAKQAAQAWKDPLPPSELETVEALCERTERAFLRWLRPGWWKLKKIVNARYDFRAHTIEPEIGAVLSKLRARYAAEEALAAADRAARSELQLEYDAEALEALLAEEAARDRAPVARALRQRALEEPGLGLAIDALARAGAVLERFRSEAAVLWSAPPSGALAVHARELAALRATKHRLPEILPQLQRFAALPPELIACVLESPRSSAVLEGRLVAAAILRRYRADKALHAIAGRELEALAEKLGSAWDELRAANGAHVVALAHQRFRALVARAGATEAGVAVEEKEARKALQRGKRELEHELGKVMRWKSIRDLSAGESGAYLRALKPVWLMSPLSVSDTLPLDHQVFDVVIFDEASQIPLEESVPTLFRGAQAIVVGDEKQLPPTNFFSARKEPEEDQLVFRDEIGSETSVGLEAESFLSHAAAHLDSCMLGWHYRSRSEALIRFSNAAFYGRNLLTIPDVAIPRERERILVPADLATLDGVDLAARCLDRPISFHEMEAAVYDRQRNPSEAAYLARLVRALLRSEKKLSLGVVAFSQAQQSEIEQALEKLAAEDESFAEQLALEEEREEDGAFVGLFVKNLENVQGDERDVILLSVCYGPDARGQVRMNFGPINQGGGEKRLNVVFSRAKRHMIVVASMKGERITNTWNDGALCFSRYLRYAEAISLGKEEQAKRILQEFSPDAKARDEVPREAVVEDLAAALRSLGHEVSTGIGASRFRTDLALRKAGEERFALGILVDTDEHYATGDLLERHVLRPRILGSFGWKVARVFAKDWREQRDTVLRRLQKLL
ncbi:MAG: DUF4011 domain-containing protein [Planctomycetes bacterium]|nr:DUF4011 domain-containing protein [Planctomycetota bacterium]